MKFSGVTLVCSLMLVATGSYGNDLSDPTLVEINRRTEEKPYISKQYYPDWLKSSHNLSGKILTLARAWIALGADIDQQVNYVKALLPDSGVNPQDPVLFSETELAGLNMSMPARSSRTPFEKGGMPDRPIGHLEALFGHYGGVDEIQQLFATNELKPSKLIRNIYSWYDNQLSGNMKDVLIARHDGVAMYAAYDSDRRWEKCFSVYKGSIAD
ncbi:hypothetical protein GZ77_15470 [Endozoicomonas montiporae]|uniref:Uncharacterized protein n=2 Tax=Endozoicomonas montiporae TaxID=1027273 RepID=A0A081N5H5_9GAMM|nr:hypothetical protein [Endozoicomonas montiporae]AMO57414.1 hypothetical protein EZMO1_3423 [Endozoicomonas montiporae CL-33]KEQ13698.1 hypothetical protein GZ77_15470 [Endozoicomonas montiporae]